MEYYLKNSFKSIYVPILRFRTANHKLPVEMVAGKIYRTKTENAKHVTKTKLEMSFTIYLLAQLLQMKESTL